MLFRSIGVPNATFVMVRMEVNFMRELHWPADIVVASGIAGFGRTSFTIAQAVFRDDMCAAAARATLACIDLDTRKPRPIPEDAIERLSKWKYLGA